MPRFCLNAQSKLEMHTTFATKKLFGQEHRFTEYKMAHSTPAYHDPYFAFQQIRPTFPAHNTRENMMRKSDLPVAM